MKYNKVQIAIVLVTLLGAINPVGVDAAQTLTNPVRIGSFNSIDMNHDGSNENVGIFPNVENGTLKSYQLIINGLSAVEEKFHSKESCMGVTAFTLDVKAGDGHTDLYVAHYNEDGCFGGSIYRYTGKKLKKICDLRNVMKLSNNPTLVHEQPGNGKLRFAVPGHPVGKNKYLGDYEIYMDFSISKGQLKCTDKTFRTTENYQNSCIEAARSFRVYKDKKQQKRYYKVTAGDKFYITKVVSDKGKIKYLMIKNLEGQSGWIQLPSRRWIK